MNVLNQSQVGKMAGTVFIPDWLDEVITMVGEPPGHNNLLFGQVDCDI